MAKALVKIWHVYSWLCVYEIQARFASPSEILMITGVCHGIVLPVNTKVILSSGRPTCSSFDAQRKSAWLKSYSSLSGFALCCADGVCADSMWFKCSLE